MVSGANEKASVMHTRPMHLAALERGCENPPAGASLAAAQAFEARTGLGVIGRIAGSAIARGNNALIEA